MPHELKWGDWVCSDDPARLDRGEYHAFIARSYWAAEIPRATMERAIANSLCLGVYRPPETRLFGAARVITDRATYAYLCDVFVHEECRGSGVGALLMRAIDSHPDLRGLRRFCLLTRDAHGLYRKFGFEVGKHADRYMERVDPDVYRRSATTQKQL